jgi:hypothetical protein
LHEKQPEQKPMKQDDFVSQAEKDIGRILARLEQDTGNVIESIKIVDIETTTMKSMRPQFARRVVIQMYQVPGSDWQ